ncbi:MAG: hypothetical protein IPO04_15590 [Cytophagaceae bacterium]|nr:hypothetical protein [Cytophagaceae bacterium]
MPKLLLGILFSLFSFTAIAQNPVRLDFSTESFLDKLPFDVSFDISGSLPKDLDIKGISLICVPKVPNADLNYFKSCQKSNITCYLKSEKKEFLCKDVRPLRPNTVYNFKFNIEEKKALPDQSIQVIKNIIFKALEDPRNFDSSKYKATNIAINNEIRKCFPNVRLIGELEVFSGELEDFSNTYMTVSNESNIYKDFLKNKIKNINDNLTYVLKNDLIIESFIKDGKTEKDLKINDNQLTTEKISLLREFVKEFKNLKKDNKILLNETEINYLDGVNSAIDAYLEFEIAKEKNEKIIVELKNSPLLLKEILILKIIDITGLADIDIETENSPYLTYESGIGARFSSNFNNLIRYGAVNISFYPINPKAKLDDFKLKPRLLKSLSLQVGLSKFLLSDDNPRIVPYKLFGDIERNLIFGFGFRPHRLFRIN